MAPSTSTPMEMAIPPRLMMLEVMPSKYMGMKARTTEMGMVMIGTMADGKCQRKRRMTRLTMIISISSSSFRLSMEPG